MGRKIGILLIKGYKKAFAWLPPTCIYSPSCSTYAMIAIEKYGLMKGSWLAIKRICRCTPFHQGGNDPVP